MRRNTSRPARAEAAKDAADIALAPHSGCAHRDQHSGKRQKFCGDRTALGRAVDLARGLPQFHRPRVPAAHQCGRVLVVLRLELMEEAKIATAIVRKETIDKHEVS